MNTWNWLLHFLIIFDLVAFGIYFGGDILFTAISKVQKKSKKNDDLDLYDFEIETAPQKRSLCVDSIRMLYSGEIDEFVEKELLPDAAETMNALSEAEKTLIIYKFSLAPRKIIHTQYITNDFLTLFEKEYSMLDKFEEYYKN